MLACLTSLPNVCEVAHRALWHLLPTFLRLLLHACLSPSSMLLTKVPTLKACKMHSVALWLL